MNSVKERKRRTFAMLDRFNALSFPDQRAVLAIIKRDGISGEAALQRFKQEREGSQ